MKIAHFGVFIPHGSGQFATIIDMIKAEKLQGLDARFIDYGKDGDPACNRVGLSYKGIETVPVSWARTADVIVRHSVVPKEIEEMHKPSVMVMHGRPENSFLLEYLEKIPVYSILYERNALAHYRAFITFWEDFVFSWSMFIDRQKIFYVPAMLDLDDMKLEGKKFDFGRKGGNPNIVIADMWREDTTPYNVLQAAMYFKTHMVSGAKIHLFGLDHKKQILDKYLGVLSEKGFIGHAWSKIDFIDEVLRAADIVVTPHSIATRIVREALACGCPIVAGGGNRFTPYTADPRDIKGFARQIEMCWFQNLLHNGLREESRLMAEKSFSLELAGEQLEKVFQYCVSENEIKLVSDL